MIPQPAGDNSAKNRVLTAPNEFAHGARPRLAKCSGFFYKGGWICQYCFGPKMLRKKGFAMVHYSTSVPMVVSRQFGDEVVIANYESGVYYSLTGTGADIWLGLNSGANVNDIIAAFSAKHLSDLATIPLAVRAFVENLLAEGIIIQAIAAPERQPWSPMAADRFSQPVIERFDDLRDLLLLDPVHDVGEAGWPFRAD